MDVSDRPPGVVEIRLEPLHVNGDLVAEGWWEAPRPAATPFYRRHAIFIVCFVIPVAVAVIYLAFFAANQYVSESRFLVRTGAHTDGANLASLLQDQKMSRASDETYAIGEYIVSRDAMHALLEKNNLRSILSRAGADFLYRYPSFGMRDTDERLFRRYANSVDVKVSSESGVAVLRVSAFTPKDAQDLNFALLDYAEQLVNQLNKRAFADSLQLANAFVAEERQKIVDVENRLTQFRNRHQLVDPNKETVSAMAQIGALTTSLADAEVNLSRLIELTPSSPKIRAARELVASLQGEIDKIRAKIAGGSATIADQYAEFDQLTLDQVLAAKGLEAAITHLISAQREAEQQAYYLQTIVKPNAPDLPTYPRRILWTTLVSAMCFCVYLISKTTASSVASHRA